MTTVQCPKCNKRGWLTTKKISGIEYWYVAHYTGYNGGTSGTRHVKWCYIGKELPSDLRVIEDES